MSSVNPSSMSDAYYNQVLSDSHRAQVEQEKAHDAEVDHMRKAHQADLDALDRAHQAERLADAERTQETVDTIRDEANRSINDSRRMHEAQNDELKSQVYDRYGRYNSRVTDEEFKNAQNAWEAQQEADQRAIRDLDQQHRRSQEESAERHAAELERAVKASRDNATQTFSQEKEEAKLAHLDTKAQLQRDYGKLARNLMEDTAVVNHATTRALDEQKKDFDHHTKQIELARDRSLERIGGENFARTERGLHNLRESYVAQANEQNRQKQALMGEKAHYDKDYSSGRDEAIKEYESDYMANLRRMQETHEAEMQKRDQKADEAEAYLGKLQKESVAERDLYYSNLIRRINQDHAERTADLNLNFNKNLNDQRYRAELDRKSSGEARERQALTAMEQQETALTKQAEAYQDTLKNQRLNYETQISNLERKVSGFTNGDDPEVPAAAEAAARKSLTKHYQKLLDAEQERNIRGQQSMQREYLDRMQTLREESDHEKLVANLRNTGERDSDRKAFIDHTFQIEADKLEAMRKNEWEADRAVQAMNRSFSRAMVEQKRKFSEALEVNRAENQIRATTSRQEADFENRNRAREYNMKSSEIIGQYERELSRLREEHQDETARVREEADAKVRAAERQMRVVMEQQEKAHANELKASEQKNEERQRVIAQNYEEQLDKSRRANARLIQKKG